MNHSIIPFDYNGVKIQVRESDGWVNLTEMCKANGKRLDVYLKSQEIKDYIARLDELIEEKSKYHRSVVLSENPYSHVIETKRGKSGGTWGHPLLATVITRKLSTDFAIWADSHILVLAKEGKTSLDTDPFARILEIMGENYGDLDNQILIDDRFYDVDAYSSWSIDAE